MSLEYFFKLRHLQQVKSARVQSLRRLKTGLGREGEKLHTYITPCKHLYSQLSLRRTPLGPELAVPS